MGKLSGLAELRRLRNEGKTGRNLQFDEEDGTIYDEYDVGEYEKRQRERLREDDFVIDDDGQGYVDNGEYEWDQQNSSEVEEDSKKPLKRDRSEKKPDIVSLFRSQKKPRVATTQLAPKVDIDAIVNSIGKKTPNTSATPGSKLGSLGSRGGLGSLGSLGGRSAFGNKLRSKPETPTKLRGSRDGGEMIGSAFVSEVASSDPPIGETTIDEPFSEPPLREAASDQFTENNQVTESYAEQVDLNASTDAEVSFSMTPVSLSAAPESDDSDDEFIAMMSNRSRELPSDPPIPEMSLPESQDDQTHVMVQTPEPSSDPQTITGSYASTAWNLVSDDVQVSTVDALKPGEVLRFYWTDYLEMQGGLILFGRSNTGVATSVLVYGIDRDIYVLPKQGSSASDVTVEMSEFFASCGVSSMRSRSVKLRDVFASDKGEKEYVHIKAPYTLSQPVPAKGKHYESVTGIQSSRIENFLIGRNIMGPCWLDVKIQNVSRNTTWSGAAYECGSPAHITTSSEQPPVPKLTLMSLTVTTVPNSKLEHELVSISMRIFRNVDVGTHDATSLPSTLITGIRPPSTGVFPIGFKQAMSQHNAQRTNATSKHARPVLEMFNSEQKLLAWFHEMVKNTDPDVLVGHNLTNIHLATILDRSLALNCSQWSQLGRFRITRKPNAVKAHEVQRICSGRLLVDLKNTFGEEIASGKCTDYSLEEMTRVFLGQQRLPFDTNLASGDWLKQGSDGLVEIVRRSEYDTLFVTSIALKNQMLPLSRQLTCLAGNPWRATLAGTRSGRNDYLLMHEFAKAGYLIPDKREAKNGSSTYTGGHVFEPVTGLHQSCVLVMDFNSLYPSIIQEYNICLTTIDFERDQTESPELPAASMPQGLLPKILQNLVERRREVKNLMKSPSADAAQQAEWNIRQTALKLTANSMYGCLGFADSRFCAKPLAQLITQKGREALLRTRDLAIEKGLEVLYGDTDSVMINTGAVTYAEAYAVGVDFKRSVNKQYRLMEIDIDHVFRKLMLYVKKKYAAVIMHPDNSLQLEYKGLDMRRREFSDVCKISSKRVLEIIFGLNGGKTDDDEEMDPLEIFSGVYQYLHEYATQVRAGKVVPKMFVMRNQLGKELSQYGALDKPQLVVAAARVASGHSVRAKDVISYIITAGGKDQSVAQRAVAPEELKRRELVPDYEWYLYHQVFVPINRFCEKIDGYDGSQLAEAMELPAAHEIKQSKRDGAQSSLYDNLSLITMTPDTIRFANCAPLELSSGETQFAFTSASQLASNGILVPESQEVIPFSEVAEQVNRAIRSFVQKYYENWLLCDECGARSRHSGSACTEPHCSGTLKPEYTSQELYTQMCYFASLFDPLRMKATTPISGTCVDGLTQVSDLSKRYIQRSGYSYINVGQYFTF